MENQKNENGLGDNDMLSRRALMEKFAPTSNITLDTFLDAIEDDDVSEDASDLLGDTADDLSSGITFANQEELPRLPIPELDNTTTQLLESLEALQTQEERLEAQQVVLEFAKSDGPKLQQLLREYEQSKIEQGSIGNYYEEFWNEATLATLATASREEEDSEDATFSGIQLDNPFLLLEDSPDPIIRHDPIKRAASLTLATLKLASTIRDETFPPDIFHEQPLCMDQYKAVFGTARVPHLRKGDEIDVYPLSSHVVVICRNQLYYFQGAWPNTGIVAVDETDLVEILTAIDRNSREMDPEDAAKHCPCSLTALPRRQWARMRLDLMRADDMNAQYMTIVDSALFVLALDTETTPMPIERSAKNMLYGLSGTPGDAGAHRTSTRWYDKLQLVVCADGTAGLNFEHSAIDGHTALRIASDIYAETVINFARSVTRTLQAPYGLPRVIEADVDRARLPYAGLHDDSARSLDVMPKKMNFSIPESIQQHIMETQARIDRETATYKTKVLEFRDFGKKTIVGESQSPDAFVQVAIMLAYYRVYGKLDCAYEPVLTKTFFHGRTEGMRPAMVPTRDLCEIFFDDHAKPMTKMAALKRAIKLHRGIVTRCSQGRGIDRHLYALKCIASLNGLPEPELFRSKAWKLLNQTKILSANCGNSSMRLFGVHPLVPEGYGIGYVIKEFSIHFCISSRTTEIDTFVKSLESVLKEMLWLLRARLMGTNGVITEKPRLEPITMEQNQASARNSDPAPRGRRPSIGSNSKRSSRRLVLPRLVEGETSATPTLATRKAMHKDKIPTAPHRGRKSAPGMPSSSSDTLPSKPQRRGSMFSSMSRRQLLTTAQFDSSGTSWDYSFAESDTLDGSDCLSSSYDQNSSLSFD